jgi:hypothetical protein
MTAKSHDRSPDKKNFSIALPIALIDQLQRIAEAEHRSRNRQIEKFLEESAQRWSADSKASAAPSFAPLAELPRKSSPSSLVTGVTVANPSRGRTRNQQKKSS